jgi:hypothetical protein
MICSGTQYCNWLDNRCGRGTASAGTCTARLVECALLLDPVCACNGQIYGNPCLAYSAGQDISETGGCTVSAGQFACGPRFCARGSQYCQASFGGPAGGPGTYTCNALPAACGNTPTCACLSGTACGATCAMSASGDLTTSCFAP